MHDGPRSRIKVVLLRAGFLVSGLVIIAGLLGMHVVVAAGHSSHAGHIVQPVHNAHSGHTGHQRELPPSAEAALHLAGGASLGGVAGDCPELSGPGAGCVLAPGTAPLTAPLPGTVRFVVPPHHGHLRTGNLSPYSYLPGSPSPGDLSISRT